MGGPYLAQAFHGGPELIIGELKRELRFAEVAGMYFPCKAVPKIRKYTRRGVHVRRVDFSVSTTPRAGKLCTINSWATD